MKRALRPASWPIAVKLSLAMVITALAPMLITAQYSLQGGLERLEHTELRNLEQIANNVSGQLDQMIRGNRHVAIYLSREEDLTRLLDAPDDLELRTVVNARLQTLMQTSNDFELMMVLDREGTAIAASAQRFLGENYGFRDYFQEAIDGRGHMSNIVVGLNTGRAGLFFSEPLRNGRGVIDGVVVFKIDIDVIEEIVDSASVDQRTAFLVDADGMLVHHPDREWLYTSLMPLSDRVLQPIVEERRFLLTEIRSLDAERLGGTLPRARAVGHVRHPEIRTGEPAITGYAPVRLHQWTVAVSQSQESFAEPLNLLFRNVVYSVLAAGLLFTLLAVALARTFVRPIRALSDAAGQLEHGEFERAHVPVHGDDELGQLAASFNRMVDGLQERQRMRDIFGRMVSPAVREQLLAGELKLGGDSRRVTVLFTDIRNFSGLCEQLGPQEVVTLLNEYLSEMAEAIRPLGGYINNFIGDAIVIVFGAPQDQEHSEQRALLTAFAMRARLEIFNQRRDEMGDLSLKVGIGISTGKAVAGQLGSMDRYVYTVIGDTVNLAARLESLTKEHEDNPVLIDERTYLRVHEMPGLSFRCLGELDIRGREQTAVVHAVLRDPARPLPKLPAADAAGADSAQQ